jgi:hypothetical protein
MSDTELNTGLATEEVSKSKVRSICLMLDEDVVIGLERLRDTLGVSIETMIEECIRPAIKTFLPFADLHQQGKLSTASIPDFQKDIESIVTKVDVAKAHFDKDINKLIKQKKAELRGK